MGNLISFWEAFIVLVSCSNRAGCQWKVGSEICSMGTTSGGPTMFRWRKADILPLPVLAKNEARIDETIDILTDYFNLSPKEVTDGKDYTIRRLDDPFTTLTASRANHSSPSSTAAENRMMRLSSVILVGDGLREVWENRSTLQSAF